MYHVRKTFSLLYLFSCMQVKEAGKVSHFAAATVEQLLESSAFEGMALRTEKAKVCYIVEMPFPMAHCEILMIFLCSCAFTSGDAKVSPVSFARALLCSN